jgi:uncharacterized repeat protein (TIGR04138 family)
VSRPERPGRCEEQAVADFDIPSIMQRAGGFSPHAFQFIRDGLSHTVEMVHGEDAATAVIDEEDESRHVGGRDLCLGLRDYAIRRYGLLAKTVLNHWGLTQTEDFGKIVFALVDAGLLRKTDDDTLEDFEGVFSFDDEFERSIEDSLDTSN